MADPYFDLAPKELYPGPPDSRGTSISDFFAAACELDSGWFELILDKGELDINSVYCYGQASCSYRPDYHMLQSFGSAKTGKVTMQIFEKIDVATEKEVKIMLRMLEILVRKGVVIEDVIFDRRKNKFSEDSLYFWFTVLRKAYIYSSDNTKVESLQTAFRCLASYLEETIVTFCRGSHIIRTTKLFTAVEESDYQGVHELLERFPEKNHFESYMRAIPGSLFPKEVYKDDNIEINPVAIALHKKDIRMLNLLCISSPYKDSPLGMTRRWRMDVTLCLDILRKDEQFFENPELVISAFHFHFPTSIESPVIAAKLFRACEENRLDRVKELMESPDLCSIQTLRTSFVFSRSSILSEKDIDRIWINKLYIEKSLVLLAVENKNLEMFEYLESKDFDITDLGRETHYDNSTKERNAMFLWYLVIKYHLENSNYRFIHNLSQKQDIWTGPALVGCLFTAARRKDIPTMELISKFSGSAWFTGPKYSGLTAHGLLVKHGLDKEAQYLATTLGPHFTELSSTEIEAKLNEAHSLEEFKELIDSNIHWLNKGFLGHKSLMMIFITSLHFSLEKFEFLLRDREADIRMVSSEKMTMLDTLLDISYFRESSAERLLNVLQYEEVHELVLMTPTFLSDLSAAISKASVPVRIVLIECFKLAIRISTQTLETIFFPKRDSRFDKEVTGIFEMKNVHDDKEMFEICAEAAFLLVGKEEKKMHPWCIYKISTSVVSIPTTQ